MENLGIDIKLILAQVVNFAIFYFIFKKFVSKPFLTFLKKQKQEEETREKFASEIEKRKEKLAEEDKKLEQKRKKELDKAIAEARKDAEEVRKEIIANAKKEADRIIQDARAEMEDERKEMYKDMRKQIAQVSTMVVQKALNEYLTTDAQKQITQNIIKHIPADTKLQS